MSKTKILIFFSFIILILVLFLGKKIPSQNDQLDIQDTEISQNITIDELSNNDKDDYQKMYEKLNNKEFFSQFVQAPDYFLQENNIKVDLQIEQNKFTEVIVSSDLFPQSLMYQLQEVLYETCNNKLTGKENLESSYHELLEQLGSKQYELTPEECAEEFPEEAEYYDGIYRFFHDDKETYLFRFNKGGTENEYSMTLKEKTGENITEISSFGMPNHYSGGVIKYGKDYYYVYYQSNYFLKCYEAIGVYRLSANAKEEKILIRYIPEEYKYTNVYAGGEDLELVDEYIKSIKEELTSNKYIERGDQFGNYNDIIRGDEVLAVGFPLNEGYRQHYKIDFANTGIPIYLFKTAYEPANATDQIALRASFYLYKENEKEALELDKLSFDYKVFKPTNGLIQMWFKEINEKIYTFQLYLTGDFYYALKVVLIEDYIITPVRIDYMIPRREMVIFE